MVMTAFGAKMNFGGLAPMVDSYREACAKHGLAPGKTMTSFLIHLSRNDAEDRDGRERCLRYFVEDAMVSVPADPAKTPDNLKYFNKFAQFAPRLAPEDLDDSTIFLGGPGEVVESLKKVEQAGLDEVVLYFGYGLKPDAMVREQMAWFMEEVAPHFEGEHRMHQAAE